MLAKSCCQHGPTEVSINGSLLPEKQDNGEEGRTWPGVEDHLELERLPVCELIIMRCLGFWPQQNQTDCDVRSFHIRVWVK